MKKILDVAIIGNGPAGISAALYTTRAGMSTLIIGKDAGALGKADKIENYYGFVEAINGNELISNGEAQAKRLGAEIIKDEVLGIGFGETLFIKTKEQEYAAHSVIISTGSARTTPKINGITDFEGRGVSYCAVCDAFFYRGKDVAVLGDGEYALHEALTLLPVVGSVTILTNGKEPKVQIPDEIKVIQTELSAFTGKNTLSQADFTDGTSLPLSGLFVAVGVAGSSDLARKVGAEIEGTKILVDAHMATNVPGLYAAGDCTGGLLQIAKAVYEGAKAGTEAIKYVRNHKL